MSLFEELKRRRVFRVAGAYLVGAWIVMQVADTFFPALHLPAWTLTLVAALAIIGFPIALVLGWMFDLTPGGIERTAGSIRFPARSAMIATMVVAVGVAGFVVVRRRAVAAKLDENAVVVLPFRVAGDASLASMREGMVDLMAAKLTGEGGPRAVDSRTTLSAWRRSVDDEMEDLPAADAVQLARKLGAGQVLLGEVVGTPGRVAINASLHSAIDGRKITTADGVAPHDSVLALVDRVVAQLLAEQAGQGERVEALLSESLKAVRAYLEGQHYYRRGDYDPAARAFKAALDEDTTFALAGLGLALAEAWKGFGSAEFDRGADIAWNHRDRLPSRDRDYVTAFLGENYPEPSRPEDIVRRWQNYVTKSPDRAEAWYELGDAYYHNGTVIDVENPTDKALDAWRRAVALDSTFMPPLEHQFEVFADREDTASLRKLASHVYTRVRPQARYNMDAAWVAAVALNDKPWIDSLKRNVDSLPMMDMFTANATFVTMGSTEHLRFIREAALRKATPAQTNNIAFNGAIFFMSMGRPREATEALGNVPNAPFFRVAAALDFEDADTVGLADAVARLAKDTIPWKVCVAEQYRIARGDASRTAATVARLRAAVAANPASKANAGVCAYELEAKAKVLARASDASAAVARLDSVLMHSDVGTNWREHFTLASARYHTALGEYEEALKATRRRTESVYGYAPLLLEQARLAARLGKRDEAVFAYRRFLKLRSNPEPGVATLITDQARSELAALAGEQQR